MRELTADQRRQISNLMRNIRRQQRAPEPRRYPRAVIDTRTYIEDYNQLNRAPYRERITMEAFTCAQ